MAVEEHRRIALHRAAAESWGEEVADTLVELVAPSGHELATREDIRGVLDAMSAMDQRWDERFAAMDERMSAMEQRWDERFAAMGERMSAMDQRWDERITALEQRWDERLTAMDQRWDERLTAMDQRWQTEMRGLEHQLIGALDRRIADAVTTQTRTVVISMISAVVAMGAIAIAIAGVVALR